MTNKGKIKYFTLGLLVATLWFLVIGGICLLISSGVIGGKKDAGDSGAVTEANIEKIEHFHIGEVQSLGIEDWDMREVVLRLEEYYEA